ncbi:hypothetical protein OG292_09850 [Streptomyces sp. NBC_01511]|uniref:hypothetical protein n=1 Tax=Streptomyces sp. NBC_01511 TaxID=2903889 RepID=UPI00386D9E4E
MITTDYQCDLTFWGRAFRALDAAPALRHSATDPGVFLLTTADGERGRLPHAFNVSSGYDQDFTVTENGKPVFGGEKLHLPGRTAAIPPLGLTVGGLRVAYATAELTGAADGRATFRALGDPGAPGAPVGESVVAVDGAARCEGARTSTEGGRSVLRVRRTEFTVHRG